MMVNGKPLLACRTLTKDYPEGRIHLMPMPSFKLIKDLSVVTGQWMDAMSKRVESWIHTKEQTDIRETGRSRCGRQDLRAGPLHRVRYLRLLLRHGAYAA